jgi:hypothetical protein
MDLLMVREWRVCELGDEEVLICVDDTDQNNSKVPFDVLNDGRSLFSWATAEQSLGGAKASSLVGQTNNVLLSSRRE